MWYSSPLCRRYDEDDAPAGERLSRFLPAQDVRLEIGLFRQRGETGDGERAFYHSYW
jgi:hypothetical protein